MRRRVPTGPDTRPRFLSAAACQDIADRLARFARGGGYTTVLIRSTWRANVRWARNLISSSGEDRNDFLRIERNIGGAQSHGISINVTSDDALVAAARRAERLASLGDQEEQYDLAIRYPTQPILPPSPLLFSAATYQLDAGQRADTARHWAQTAAGGGMLSAGYVEVSAHGMALIGSWGFSRYCQYTSAQYSVTVRDPSGTGSGWAGVDWPDWSKINGDRLSAIALDKCLKSRNPVAVEPGRYTTILEPQAVCDFVSPMFGGNFGQDSRFEGGGWWNKVPNSDHGRGTARFGELVMDERITISANPNDPDLLFPPFGGFALEGDALSINNLEGYWPTTWIENGRLMNLPREFLESRAEFGQPTSLDDSGAFRISVGGEPTSMDEMIATTKRGLLVTRFDQVVTLDYKSMLGRGYTRDGLWLIENGHISKAIKNFAFTESPLFALNNVEQLGVPQRAFRPAYTFWQSTPQPVFVPPIKVRDFSFTALVDAV